MSTTDTDVEHQRVRVGDQRLGVIHSGSRYLLGFGANYYGIWEQGTSAGTPTEKFPATGRGRLAAWERYVELEPSSNEALVAAFAQERGIEEAPHGWTKTRLILIGAVVVVAVAAIVLAQLSKGGGGATEGAGPLGNTAHLDVTGAQTVSIDLTQSAFKVSDFKGIFPSWEAQWTAPTVTLLIHDNIPKVGDDSTSQVPDKRVEITITAATGGTEHFKANNGECTFTLQTLEEEGVTGTLDCTGMKDVADATKTIDVKGTFAAKA
jgi:hypothetical protein